MQKENIVDFEVYREQKEEKPTETSQSVSQELEIAIKDLILQLREGGPR